MFNFFKNKNKKNKKNNRNKQLGIFDSLKKDTIRGILAILFFIIGVFFILSAFGNAGIIGNGIFRFFSSMFGVGYFILPILSFLLSALFIKSFNNSFGILKIISVAVFFLSGIGLVELIFTDKGGLFGDIIVNPLVGLFDVFVTLMILWGMAIASILILFEAKLPSLESLKTIFSKKNSQEEEYESYDENEDEEEKIEEDEEEKTKTEYNKNEKKKSTIKNIFGLGENKDTDEIIQIKQIRVGSYTPPPLSLLEKDKGKPGVGDIKANANIIRRTLQNFGVDVQVDEISIGPSVTRYALKPAEGVRLSKIIGLQNNLELALAAHPVRIEAPIPGRSLVGIEVPNTAKTTVGLYTLLSSETYQKSNKPLLVSLGKDIAGQSHFADLAKMPHLLIAGATGSGKSVSIHTIINSLLFRNSAQQLRFIMIDPKRVELTLYNNIPHLLTPVITDAKKAILALKWAGKEMERRYEILEKNSSRDIDSYHKHISEFAKKQNDEDMKEVDQMPYILVIIDELADIMQMYPRELESAVVRLAQMSRAVGIHLVLSTQRPSVNVITGLIKANIPSRIALQVASQIDSRTILDGSGAEKLLGAGDMLYLSGDMSKPKRLQTAFISENEVKKVTKYLIKNYGYDTQNEINLSTEGARDINNSAVFESILEDNEGDEEDEHYEEARSIVIHAGKASTSYLQRKLRIGYSRAARLIDMLEEKGVIGPADGAKSREIFEKNPDKNKDDEDEKNIDEQQKI
ncbi:cell division protein FtsK [Candidatus Campbellbacteria bacterium CG10_big_fil_rev_8_21_14_0_10_35_52]|uniref:Cell division protein FtsK n=1 Tax=Candidatus Campbellbacteria bacterium CG10_big_fil_rev_8_21_14_0_10_35_52 TaxID=1974527 RepID=A0A2M6WVQ6_9BACT|nr:MAG: cell division protein FtsK [Candidatus Campbellbacteria bacterium CG10_big_fil_rev_8_21_14_0_10_35_52]